MTDMCYGAVQHLWVYTEYLGPMCTTQRSRASTTVHCHGGSSSHPAPLTCRYQSSFCKVQLSLITNHHLQSYSTACLTSTVVQTGIVRMHGLN